MQNLSLVCHAFNEVNDCAPGPTHLDIRSVIWIWLVNFIVMHSNHNFFDVFIFPFICKWWLWNICFFCIRTTFRSLKKKKFYYSQSYLHSSEIRGLCLIKLSSEMLYLPYFWNKKTQTVFFSFFILSNLGFWTMDAACDSLTCGKFQSINFLFLKSVLVL